MIPETSRTIRSKHVTFDESLYPLSGTQSKTAQSEERYFDENDDIIQGANYETANEQSVMKRLPTVQNKEVHSDVVLSATQQSRTIGCVEENKITQEDSQVAKEAHSKEIIEHRYP